MNNKRNRKLLFAVLCSCAIAAMGQTATDTLRLSLDDCIRIALNENPTIKVAEMEITKVDYSKKEVLGQLLPTVTFSGSYQRTLAKQTMYMDTEQGTAKFRVGRDNAWNTGFNASMPLVMPTLWKSIKLSDTQILQNVEAARSSRLSLVNQVKNAYYALLLAVDSKKVIEENHATAKMNAEIFSNKFKLGTASEYDVLRANVAVTNLEPSILEADNSINQCLLQLKVLMGMDVRANVAPGLTLEQYKDEMLRYAPIDTTLAMNSDLRKVDIQTEYLKKALDVQKAAWYPTLTGSVNYMWNSMSNGNPFQNFQWSGYSTAGLTLSFPLFTGGQRYYKQKQAEVSLREMKWQRENLERSLGMQVKTQLDHIDKSLVQISSNEGGVRQAEKAKDIMQKSFKIGAASFIQLRDTEDALMSARLAYYQAIYDYLVAQSNLELVLGKAPLEKYVTTTGNQN
ncbi:MAG: TolC family protein [Sodaliphilus sp.]|nr:TolC family protein [Sodaliphilus sp.]